MGARQKINELHYLGIGIASVIAGCLFASLDLAILVGLVLAVVMVSGGGIRLTPDVTANRPSRRGRRRQ